MFKKNYNLKYFWPQTSPVASNRGGLGGKATTMFNTVATSLLVDRIPLEVFRLFRLDFKGSGIALAIAMVITI